MPSATHQPELRGLVELLIAHRLSFVDKRITTIERNDFLFTRQPPITDSSLEQTACPCCKSLPSFLCNRCLPLFALLDRVDALFCPLASLASRLPRAKGSMKGAVQWSICFFSDPTWPFILLVVGQIQSTQLVQPPKARGEPTDYRPNKRALVSFVSLVGCWKWLFMLVPLTAGLEKVERGRPQDAPVRPTSLRWITLRAINYDLD